MRRPQLNLAQAGIEPAGALLRYHHRKVFGFRRERHDGAEWDRNGRVRNFPQTDRSDHARLQMTVAIADGHFNREDSVSRIGCWADACHPPHHGSAVGLFLARYCPPCPSVDYVVSKE